MINWLERTQQRWLTLAIIGGVLALSAWAGSRSPTFSGLAGINASALVPFAAPFGALLFLIGAFRDLRLGVLGLFWVGGVFDLPLGTGTQTSIPLAMLFAIALAAVWLIQALIGRPRARFGDARVNKAVLAFVGAMLLSTVVGMALVSLRISRPASAPYVQAMQIVLYALLMGAMLMTASLRWSERWLKLCALGTIAVSVIGLAAANTIPRGVGPFSPVQPVLFVGIVLLLAQLILNRGLHLPWKLAGWAMIAVWTVYTFGTERIQFAGGWIPILAALMVLLWMRSRALWLGATAGGAALLAVGAERLNALIAGETASASLLRPYIWSDVIRMASDSVLSVAVGMGPVNYKWAWLDPTFVSESKLYTGAVYIAVGDVSVFYAPPSHNIYVDIYAQFGIVGLLVFGWLLFALLRAFRNVFGKLPDGFPRAYAGGVVAALMGALVLSGVSAEWLMPFVYNLGTVGFRQSIYLWLLMGTLVGVARTGWLTEDGEKGRTA